MSRYVSFSSARSTRAAATGMSPRLVQFASRADVRRDSLQDDARVLQARGVTHGEIATRLGVTRRTVVRWLS
ncbi:HTH domain-containing protein [Tessaracoccus sp. HDW20]|nr:HTH domain-containing protein [Tessaracoccus coleopterorum]